MQPDAERLEGKLLDDTARLSLAEISRACEIRAEYVITMVEEGVLQPRGAAPQDWEFTCEALRHARLALRLQRDLQVNLAGAAVAIDLLERLEAANRRIAVLEHQLDW